MSFTPSLFEPHQSLVLADIERALNKLHADAHPTRPAQQTQPPAPAPTATLAEPSRAHQHSYSVAASAPTVPLAQPGGGGPHAALDDARMRQQPAAPPALASGRVFARYASMMLFHGR